MFKSKKLLVINKKDYDMVIEKIAKDNNETIEISEKTLQILLRREDITTKIGEGVIQDGIIEITNHPKRGFTTCYNTGGFLDEYCKKANKLIDSVLSIELEHINRNVGKTIGRRPIESLPIFGKLFK